MAIGDQGTWEPVITAADPDDDEPTYDLLRGSWTLIGSNVVSVRIDAVQAELSGTPGDGNSQLSISLPFPYHPQEMFEGNRRKRIFIGDSDNNVANVPLWGELTPGEASVKLLRGEVSASTHKFDLVEFAGNDQDDNTDRSLSLMFSYPVY